MSQALKSKLAEMELQTRGEFKPETVNEEERSIEFVMSTEKPVRMLGFDGPFEEILLADGASFEGETIPVLDSHDIFSIRNLVGSSRNNRSENNEVIGRTFFSSKQLGEDAYKDVKEGHLKRCSIGYRVEAFMELEPGQETQINGRSFKAGEIPLRIVSQYLIRENSLVVLAKNDEAKVRGHKNMPNENKPKEPQVPSETQNRGDTDPPATPPQPAFDEKAEKERVANEMSKRYEDITDLCTRFDIDPKEYIKNPNTTVEQVRNDILTKLEKQRSPGKVKTHVEVGQEQVEKVSNFVEACLDLRFDVLDEKGQKQNPKHLTLVQLSSMLLKQRGVKAVEFMPQHEIASMAIRSVGHSVSDFPNILANTANKRLSRSFEEVGTTWEQWCSVFETTDFKEQSVNALSESEDLEIVPAGKDYPQASFDEKVEKYQVENKGKIFTLTWQAIINDDLRAFISLAKRMGAGANRTIEKAVYAILSGNPLMGDGVALFAAGHNNLEAPATALDYDTFNVAYATMLAQTGLKGEITGYEPRWLIVPPALRSIAKEIAESPIKPVDNQSGKNINQGVITPVIAPQLAASSNTAWYLSASNSLIDTVEVGFLQGFRRPKLEQMNDFDSDCRKFKVKQPFTAKALDHRGLYKNPGA